MSKSSSKFPKEAAACLWSYDVEKLDLIKDRQEIITQVLNYGTWPAVKWLRSTYSDQEIGEVVQKPARGRWFKQCLNFWLLECDLKLSDDLYQKALFNLQPSTKN